MRIAVVHSFYSDAVPSGENVVVASQVDALARSGHAVELVARHTDQLNTGKQYQLSSGWTVVTGKGPSPEGRLAAFSPDIVHLHNTFPNWGTSWLDQWSSRTVVTLHNYRTVCAAATLFRDGKSCHDCLLRPVVPAVRFGCYQESRVRTLPLAIASSPRGSLRRIGNRAARLIVLNSEAQQMFRTVFDREVELVPNFVDAGSLSHTAPTRRWLFVGRLAAEKGVLELLNAWPEGEPLDLVGSGPLEGEVRRAADRMRGANVLGNVSHSRLVSSLHEYRGLLLPSLWPEGLPTVLLEALASGLPVVVSDRVSAAGRVQAAGAGTIYDPSGGVEAVRAALGRVISGGASMRTAAHRMHEREYSREVWLKRIGSIYQDVLRGDSRHLD